MVRCYITDRRRLGRSERQRREALLEQVAAVAAAGIEFIQLREKDLDGGALLALARAALTRIGTHGCRLLINDRLDVALASGAAGVHLPAAGLPPATVRASAPPGFLIAVSCHSLAEVTAAAQAGADACVLAPIFATPSKPGAPGLG
ncbi:MAG: thiamine phosphate synthase, partial [Terriglobales bacterium]